MAEDIRNLVFPISRITNPKTRRALVYAFGDGSKGIMATEILSYLAYCYIGQIKKNNLRDGFMVKTIADIQHGTGTGKDTVRGYLGWLAEKKLIEIVTGGLDNKTQIKVDLIRLEMFITESEETWDKTDSDYIKAQTEKLKATKAKLAKNQKSVDLSGLNATVWDNNPVKVESSLKGTKYEADWIFIWLFNHYYRKYTGQIYQWSEIKLNTLKQAWNPKGLRKGTEYGISKAIAQAFKGGENEYKFFEERFRVHYDPDLKPGQFRPGEEVIEVLFDNLRNQ